MLFSYSKLLFFFCLMSGVLLSVSSDSWFGAWCGLELNLMSFIPFISVKKNQYSSEASLKYFLIQALGSAFIVLGSIMILISPSSLYMLTMALLLKLGAAPVHFWFPQVMEGLMWTQCIILMTVQKIAPMFLLSYCVMSENNLLIFVSGVLSAIVGAIGGVNQTLLRKLLAFSSINHMSWMMFGMFMSEVSWTLYFAFYSVVSLSVVLLLSWQQVFHMNQLTNINKGLLSLVSFLSLLSLGGLPPFTGFIPKWIMIQEMIFKGMLFPLLVLLTSSLITLYYYLRLTMTHMMMLSPKLKILLTNSNQSENVPLFIFVNFVGLVFPSLFILV